MITKIFKFSLINTNLVEKLHKKQIISAAEGCSKRLRIKLQVKIHYVSFMMNYVGHSFLFSDFMQ